MLKQPSLFILSAPSGAGKTTISQKAINKVEDLVESISYTTRKPRESDGEVDGKDYFFITREEFKHKIDKNELLEWAEIYGNYYGTSKKFVEDIINDGKNVLMVIDIQGACNIKKLDYLHPVFIFIKPPSIEVLRQRLHERGTEDSQSLKKRLDAAEYEMSFADKFDYVILNDDLDTCVDQFIEIVDRHSS
jgi:guanylate kinase